MTMWRGLDGGGSGGDSTVVIDPAGHLSGAGTAASPMAVSPAFVARVAALEEGGGGAGAPGASAYEVAVANGFVGTVTEWLASLHGADGVDGLDGAAGDDGVPGATAYEVAVINGFVGDVQAWLASLQGVDGGDGIDGADGMSAYQIALANGFVGTVTEWLASLQGAPGTSLSFVRLTQAAYDALTPAERDDPAILYLITG